MLNVKIDKGHVEIETINDLKGICSDLSVAIYAIYEKFMEQDSELGYLFKLLFTKGFMDGICFRDDREHMIHYLAEADCKFKARGSGRELAKILSDLFDFLKDREAEEQTEEDDSDEDE